VRVYSVIIDDFLFEPTELRNYALSQEFTDFKNPTDGISYPNINLNIPDTVKFEFLAKIQGLTNGIVVDPKLFMRLRLAGEELAPHEVHTDKIMGEYTALVYLSRPEDCRGGTAILEHISGELPLHPETEEQLRLWERDTNDVEAWSKVSFCPMKFNRFLMIRSDLLHRAEPIGGFGDNKENGRLVLTCFFNLKAPR
jgi:hypothetical protein